MEIETQKKAIIRIANRPRKRFKINSDNDKTPTEISNGNNNKINKKNEIKENEIKKNEIKKKNRLKYVKFQLLTVICAILRCL